MKFIVTIFFLVLVFHPATAQKMMLLDDSLKANSELMPVKMRGGTMRKFDFGIYRTVSAKAGWTKTTSRSKLFSFVEKSESKQKSSVVIAENVPDTATVIFNYTNQLPD